MGDKRDFIRGNLDIGVLLLEVIEIKGTFSYEAIEI